MVNSENEYQTSLINPAKDLELDDISGFEVTPIDENSPAIASADEVYANAPPTIRLYGPHGRISKRLTMPYQWPAAVTFRA